MKGEHERKLSYGHGLQFFTLPASCYPGLTMLAPKKREYQYWKMYDVVTQLSYGHDLFLLESSHQITPDSTLKSQTSSF